MCVQADEGSRGAPTALEEPRSQRQPPWGLPGTAVSDSRGVSRGGLAPAPPLVPHSLPPEESNRSGFLEESPSRFRRWGRCLGLALKAPPAASTAHSRVSSTMSAHTCPFLGAASGDPRCPGLGLGPGQLGRRGWRSEEVVVSLYIRNCMEITVSSSSTPRLPTSQGRWCSR